MNQKKEKSRLSLILIALVLTLVPVARAHGRDNRRKSRLSGILPTLTSPLGPAPPGLTGEAVIDRMRLENRRRNARLKEYSAVRTYEVRKTDGSIAARETVRLDYQAPHQKRFTMQSASGSWVIRDLVFRHLIESEVETSEGTQHRDSSISSANYDFILAGVQDVGIYPCFVVQVAPKRKGKYVFVGTVWIEETDFAVVRIAGRPVRKPSFWIDRADFVRQYEDVNGFWFPATDQTLVKVRFFGKRVFTIHHRTDSINGQQIARQAEAARVASPPISLPGVDLGRRKPQLLTQR